MIKINSKEGVKNKILSILIDSKKPITVSEMSKNISKSGRTIRNYLNELEEELKVKGIKLYKKPNVGIYLESSEENKAKLKRTLNSNEYNKYSSEYRQKYILRTLFKNKYTYTIQLLADDLYCSKSTIVNDLSHVQKWLEKCGLILKRKPNQGLWIEGNEKLYRRAMMDLFYELKSSDKFYIEDIVEKLDYRIDFVNYKKIKELFPRVDFYKIQSVIQLAEEKLGYYFTDQAFVNLLIHIAITIERVKNKKEISMEKESFNKLKKNYEFEVATWVIKKLSEEFNITFPEDEIGYISLHMLGAKVQEDTNLKEYDVLLDSQNKFYIDIAKEIINLVGDILNVNLNNDKQLLTGLVLHLRPTIVRLQNGLKLRNPMLERIKSEYTSIFGAVWACSTIFEKKVGILINEDEVAYIALHVAVALSRIQEKIKVVVVCSSGVGTSQLVATRIKNTIEEIEIISVIPLNLLSDDIKEKVDLIITTIQGIKNDPKVIYISTLVDEADIVKIKDRMKKINPKNSNCYLREDKTKAELECEEKSIIDESLCFIEEEKKNFEEIIKYYGTLMEKLKYAKKGFYENVLKREEKSSTVIGKGIAIPHSTEEFVKESKICIVKLKNPIEYNSQNLNLIIILCLKFKDINDTKNFFRKFYSILNDELLINKIVQTNNKKDIVNIFLKGDEKL